MHKIKRKELFLEKLKKSKFITSRDFIKFANELGINETTARRDLKELELEEAISLSFGGISLKINDDFEESRVKKLTIEIDKKCLIAKTAVKLLCDQDIIFCSAGTTMEKFVSKIKKTIKMVVTNSLTVFNESRKNRFIKDVVLLGGLFREKSQVFSSKNQANYFNEMRLSKTFFSALSIDDKGNVYDDFDPEIDVILKAMNNCQSSYLLIDSSKFINIGANKITNINSIKYIITDNCSEQMKELLKDKLILAKRENND